MFAISPAFVDPRMPGADRHELQKREEVKLVGIMLRGSADSSGPIALEYSIDERRERRALCQYYEESEQQ